MTKHLQRDMERLERGILTLGSLVEDAINKSIVALVTRRRELAEEVLRIDNQIDRQEVELEEDCLKTMALHQPVAMDLRFLVMVLKVNNSLERMGDHAMNIAKSAIFLSTHEALDLSIDLMSMCDHVRSMVRQCLDAMVNENTVHAQQVCGMDDGVDSLNHDLRLELQHLMITDPGTVERSVQVLLAARHLERIGDLATNIAEDVVFCVDGAIIRHGQHHDIGASHVVSSL
jgi:phosphate transport system protein